jgi:hypothetical protein
MVIIRKQKHNAEKLLEIEEKKKDMGDDGPIVDRNEATLVEIQK